MDFLKKKWLNNVHNQFEIELFPDENKWLKEVNVSFFSKEGSKSLAGNFMLHDLFLAYNLPKDDVIYLFYELRNIQEQGNSVQFLNNKIQKKENLFDEAGEKSVNPFDNLEFFESKRKFFSNFSENSKIKRDLPENTQNSLMNKSLSFFSFSQRVPFKQTENIHSSFSNIKFNSPHIHEKSFRNNSDNFECSRFIRKTNEQEEENLNGGVSQFFEKSNFKSNSNFFSNYPKNEKYEKPTIKSVETKIVKADGPNILKKEEKNIVKTEEIHVLKKDQHFLKINAIIDSLGKAEKGSFL